MLCLSQVIQIWVLRRIVYRAMHLQCSRVCTLHDGREVTLLHMGRDRVASLNADSRRAICLLLKLGEMRGVALELRMLSRPNNLYVELRRCLFSRIELWQLALGLIRL